MKSLRHERAFSFARSLYEALADPVQLSYKESLAHALDLPPYTPLHVILDHFKEMLAEDSILEELAYVKAQRKEAK